MYLLCVGAQNATIPFELSVIFLNKTNDTFVEIKHPVQQEKVPRFFDLLYFNQTFAESNFFILLFQIILDEHDVCLHNCYQSFSSPGWT